MKKVLTLLVAIIAGIGTLYAEVVSGSCSTKYQTTDVVWSIDLETGVMTISGNGVFPEYSHVWDLPWNDYSDLIRKVVFTEGVTSVGGYAFRDCVNLTTIQIAEGVTRIENAFTEGCSALTSVNIPNSVTSVEDGFRNTALFNDASNWDNGSLYIDNWLISVKDTVKNEYKINDSTVGVISNAFYNCENNNTICVGEKVTYILSYAFNKCPSLTKIIWNAKRCQDFSLNNSPFYYLREYSTNPDYDYRLQIRNFEIGLAVEYIPAYLCYGMNNVSQVAIPCSVKSIGESAFDGCNTLSNSIVTHLPDTIICPGEWIFDGKPEKPKYSYWLVDKNSPFTFELLCEDPCAGCDMGCTNCVGDEVDWKDVYSYLSWVDDGDECPEGVDCCESYANGQQFFSSGTFTRTYRTALGCDSIVTRNVIVYNTIAPSYTVTPIQDGYQLGSVRFEGGSYGRYTVDGGAFQTDNPYGGLSEGVHTFVFGYENGCNYDTLHINIPFLNFKVNGVYYSPNVDLEFKEGCGPAGECTDMDTIGYYATVTYRGSYYGEYSNSYSGDVVIPDSVVYNNRTYAVNAINNYAFVGCKNITSLTIQNMTPPRISDDFQFSTSTPIYVPFGSLSAYRSTFRYSDKNLHVINPKHVTIEIGSTSATIYFGNEEEQRHIDAWGVVGKEEFGGSVAEYNGLEPNKEYTNVAFYIKTIEGDSDVISVSFKTSELTLTTQASKPVSSSAAILLAQTNISDIEVNCGFEYKRDGAPAGYTPSKVYYPVAEGVMAGRLKNLKDDVYYQYRAFYESTSGKSYYGDWKYIFTGDQSVEFNPIVNTYKASAVREHQATLKGYALEGADDFTEQGFEYWADSRVKPNKMPARGYKAQIGDKKTVTASGISMTVTITDLDAGTVYKYRTYAKFDEKVVYGQEMSFTTQGEWVSYTVTFVGKDGKVLSTQQIEPGKNASAPEAPEIDGFRFTGWDKDFSNVQGDLTVTAQYAEVVMATLVVKSADETMGTVKGGGVYAEGIKVKITAVPNKGYRFVMWNDGNTDNPRTVTVAAKTYTAVFEEEPAESDPTNPGDPEQSDQGIETVSNDPSPITNKILRDAQILILRDGKTYNVMGVEVK